MGQPTAQTIEIMETTAEIIAESQQPPQYGWLILVGVIPVVVGVVIKKWVSKRKTN